MKRTSTLLALLCFVVCSAMVSCSTEDSDIPDIEEYVYTSILFDEPSTAILREYAMAHNPWDSSDSITYSCNHMTVFHMNDTDSTGAWKWSVEHRGETIELRATTVGYSDHCFAMGIETDVPVITGVPHATLIVNNTNGGSAWESRLIENWVPLDKEIILRGVVTFHPKN